MGGGVRGLKDEIDRDVVSLYDPNSASSSIGPPGIGVSQAGPTGLVMINPSNDPTRYPPFGTTAS